MSPVHSVDCPLTGIPQRISKHISVGKYRVAWVNSSQMWTTIDVPSVEDLSLAYQEFDAGVLSRENFDSYLEQSVPILKAELSKAGVNADLGKLKFFDYGCGGGHFLAAAQSLGMAATGIELDSKSVREANRRGLNVIEGYLPEDLAKLKEQKFDIVKVSHVLEHAPNLKELVKCLISVLNPDGLLIINVPDQNSLPSRLKVMLRKVGLKRLDYGYVQPPIHLHGFTKKSFQIMAATNSMQLISVYDYSPLDVTNFPTSSGYWRGARVQKVIYRIAQIFGSGGYLTAILKKA